MTDRSAEETRRVSLKPSKVEFFVSLVSGLLAVAGAGLLLRCANLLHEAQASLSWPETQGVVVSSADGKEYVSKTRKLRERGSVVYKYAVDGRPYQGSRIDYIVERIPGVIRGDFPEGQAVAVKYDPADPRRSVLRPGWTVDFVQLWSGVWAGAFLVVVFGADVAWRLRLGLLGRIRPRAPLLLREPGGLTARLEEGDPAFSCIVLSLPKQRLTWSTLFWAPIMLAALFPLWLQAKGTFSFGWLMLLAVAGTALIAIVRYLAKPRLLIKIFKDCLVVVDAVGVHARSVRSRQFPYPRLAEIVVGRRCVALGRAGVVGRDDILYDASLSEDVMAWIGALLKLLHARAGNPGDDRDGVRKFLGFESMDDLRRAVRGLTGCRER